MRYWTSSDTLVSLLIGAVIVAITWAIVHSIAIDNANKDNCRAHGGHPEGVPNGDSGSWVCISNEDPNRIIRL